MAKCALRTLPTQARDSETTAMNSTAARLRTVDKRVAKLSQAAEKTVDVSGMGGAVRAACEAHGPALRPGACLTVRYRRKYRRIALCVQRS